MRRDPWALRRCRRGGAALEFAVVALPFLTLLLFLVELGYDFFAQVSLDHGVQSAARQIQVGRAQGANTAALFKSQYLCPAVDGLLPCAAIEVDVRPVTSDFYTATPATLPVDQSGAFDTRGYTYCPGRPNQLMLVQAVYTSPSIIAAVVPSMAVAGPGGYVRVTLSSTAFINENYPVTAAGPAGC